MRRRCALLFGAVGLGCPTAPPDPGGDGTSAAAETTLNPGETTSPREPVGDAIMLADIGVDSMGVFAIDLGELMVTGDANPITGSDIVATLSLAGELRTPDFWCGTASGMVTEPAAIDLTGSTFAAVRIAAADPESLPTEVIGACP